MLDLVIESWNVVTSSAKLGPILSLLAPYICVWFTLFQLEVFLNRTIGFAPRNAWQHYDLSACAVNTEAQVDVAAWSRTDDMDAEVQDICKCFPDSIRCTVSNVQCYTADASSHWPKSIIGGSRNGNNDGVGIPMIEQANQNETRETLGIDVGAFDSSIPVEKVIDVDSVSVGGAISTAWAANEEKHNRR